MLLRFRGTKYEPSLKDLPCISIHRYQALRLKAAQENRSVSDIVNEAVALLASEDAEDIETLIRDELSQPSITQALYRSQIRDSLIFQFKSSAKGLEINPTRRREA